MAMEDQMAKWANADSPYLSQSNMQSAGYDQQAYNQVQDKGIYGSPAKPDASAFFPRDSFSAPQQPQMPIKPSGASSAIAPIGQSWSTPQARRAFGRPTDTLSGQRQPNKPIGSSIFSSSTPTLTNLSQGGDQNRYGIIENGMARFLNKDGNGMEL